MRTGRRRGVLIDAPTQKLLPGQYDSGASILTLMQSRLALLYTNYYDKMLNLICSVIYLFLLDTTY